MTAVLLGSFTVSGAIPGMNEFLVNAGEALQDLASTAKSVTSALGSTANLLNDAAGDLDNLKDELIAGPFDALSNQIETVEGLLRDLRNLAGAPSDFLQGEITKLNDAVDVLVGQLEDAEGFLQSKIDAMSAGLNTFEDALGELQSQISGAISARDLVSGAVDSLRGLQNTLDDAIDDATNAIGDWLAALSQLSNGGVYVVHYNGTLGNLGSEVQAVLPGTGLPNSDIVVGPLLVAAGSGATVAAIRSTFGITI